MEFYRKLQLKQTASGLGFYIFAMQITMYVIAISGLTASILSASSYDTTVSLLLDNIVSIISIFFIGLFYCALSKTNLQKTIPIKKVSGKLLINLVFISLSVAFISDYITEIFLTNVSIFGIHNNVSLEFSTNNYIENILYVISVALIPPLVEEFAFRGIILHKLREYGDTFAVLISALLFGLVHGNIVQIPFAFIVGIALGFVTIKANSLIPAMITHFIINFSSVLITILNDNKILNENLIETFYIGFILIVVIGAIFSAIRLAKNKRFFTLDTYAEISFKDRVKTVFSSTGIIFVLVVTLIEIIISVG
ncbi:MAG: CPBP family intramembrane metalloprotease [Ruminococcus sp.]|nr:CPBP family intramembrane metalloprotease [Ruminococcus sp.]